MSNDIWILFADTRKARVFCATKPPSEDIVEIETFVQPETALNANELMSNNLARFTQRATTEPYPKGPSTSLKKKNAQEFARQLADYLDMAHQQGHFNKLGIVAEPAMLGELRAQISPSLAQDICFEIDKNFTQMNGRDFRKHLPEKLASTQL